MSRSKGQTGWVVERSATLESAMAALVRWEYVECTLMVRLEQAKQLSELRDLLDPALQELDEMTVSIQAAKEQISHVLAQLL